MGVIKKTDNSKYCQICRKRDTTQGGGNVNWCSHYRTIVEVPPKIKNRANI
jgi:hypothetical protein